MNKYLALLALGVACFAVASAAPFNAIEDDLESEASLTPDNDQEIAFLEGKTAVFSDYCIASRDYVIGDLKATSNGVAGRLFNIFFAGAENLGLEAVNVQREAAEKLEAQIRNPESPIGAFDESNEVDAIIADGQHKIQESASQPRNLFQAFVSTLAATKNVVTSQVLSKIDIIKSAVNLATFTGALKDACDRVAAYDQELVNRFEQTKAELAARDPSIATIQLQNVGCVTVRRVIRLDGICKFAMAAQNPLIKAITYQPIATRPNEQ